MKTKLMQLLSRIRQGVSNLSLQTGALVVVFGCLLFLMAFWTGTANPSGHVAAQEMPTPTVDSGSFPEYVEAWRAAMEASRAPLPASVVDFNDLVEMVALAPKLEERGVEEGLLQTPRPLGNVTVLSGPTPCDGQECYEIRVTCPELAQSIDATLMVGVPGGTVQGTIFFASGWTGTYWWGYPGTNYETIVNELLAAGFRTVQVKWNTNWWAGASDQLEGYAKLACRPATVLRWVYYNLHQDVVTPFCVEGHSNGASQVGYAITQYGLADLLSLVLFESGPNYARIDHACIKDTSDPGNQALFYADPAGRGHVNLSLGLPQASGACVAQDETYRSVFEEISLAFDYNWQYYYTSTRAAFVFGKLDVSTTAVHGLYYHNRLGDAGSPWVSMTVVTDTDHFVGRTPQGMVAIRDTLLNECVVLHPSVVYLPLATK